METVIVIVHKPESTPSKLTKFFTGSTAMHIGFVSNNKFYDMNLIFRRRKWPYYGDNVILKFYKCPVSITQENLEEELDTSTDVYGFYDYLMFSLRKLFKFKKKWPNYKGSICSEKVNKILIKYGWDSPFVNVPSPADFEKVLEEINY